MAKVYLLRGGGGISNPGDSLRRVHCTEYPHVHEYFSLKNEAQSGGIYCTEYTVLEKVDLQNCKY